MCNMLVMFYTAFRHPRCSGVISMEKIPIVNILVIVLVEYYTVQRRAI
jgi:hypothetical protein